MPKLKKGSPDKTYTIFIGPLKARYTPASTRWDRNDLLFGLMKTAEPQGWIAREAAEVLADTIIAVPGKKVVELQGNGAS